MRLHELCFADKPVKLIYDNKAKYEWNGKVLVHNAGFCGTVNQIVLSDNWQLDAPTLESVCKERGWKLEIVYMSSDRTFLAYGDIRMVRINNNWTPAKLAKMLDELEGKEI